VDRPDVVSYGVVESDALREVLGELGDDRETDLIKAVTNLEELVARAPYLLRALYHGLYQEYRPQNSDVWARVGAAVGKTKNQAWRKAHLPEEGPVALPERE
jgi:hypothetical protein